AGALLGWGPGGRRRKANSYTSHRHTLSCIWGSQKHPGATGDLQPTEAAEEQGAPAEHRMHPHPFLARRRMERHPQTARPPPRSKPPSTTMSVPHGAAPVARKSQSARSPRKAQSPPPTTNAIESMRGKESSGMDHLHKPGQHMVSISAELSRLGWIA